jgi:hypothetical protein
MHTYCAFVGHQPHVSFAELAACIPDLTVERWVNKQMLLFATSKDLTQADLQAWGGTWLLAKRIESASTLSLTDVPQLLGNACQSIQGKVTFSIRSIGLTLRAHHDLYRTCKEELRRRGQPSRYIGTERRPTATILLHQDGIVDSTHGCELVLLQEGEEDERTLWVGRTVAVQNPESYTERDIGKPARDSRVGMLPPKLAQVLLNLGAWLLQEQTKRSGSKATAAGMPIVVYDPFCGSGVVLMEAMLRGWHVLGSDASVKAVNATLRNIEWLRKEQKIPKKMVESEVWKHDIIKPFALTEHTKLRPQCIVTETMLGPAFTKRPTIKEAQKCRTQCDALQTAFFKNVAAAFPGAPLALTFPVWFASSGPVFLEKVWAAADAAGLKPALPPGVAFSHPGRVSLLYSRPDQFVGREIVLFRLKK